MKFGPGFMFISNEEQYLKKFFDFTIWFKTFNNSFSVLVLRPLKSSINVTFLAFFLFKYFSNNSMFIGIPSII